jgi:hypothetical protein
MKGSQVSALRERGLRRECGAEPQRGEPKFKQLNERKPDTMKTYILPDPNTVEPHRERFVRFSLPAQRKLELSSNEKPATSARSEERCRI